MIRAALAALALAALWPAVASARMVLVQGPDGPYYTNVPEPAADELVRLSARSGPFRDVVRESAERHGVDPALVEAVIACESNFDPEAVSRVGACGLMQLMPETAARYGLRDPFDVDGNVDAGTRHLAELLRTFGDRRLAVAAYNAGAGAVSRAGGIPPFPETRRYLTKVERYLALLESDGAAVDAAAPPPAPSEADPAPPPAPVPPPAVAMARLPSTQVAAASAAPSRAPAKPPSRTVAVDRPQRPSPPPPDATSLRLVRDAQGRLLVTNLPQAGSGR